MKEAVAGWRQRDSSLRSEWQRLQGARQRGKAREIYFTRARRSKTDIKTDTRMKAIVSKTISAWLSRVRARRTAQGCAPRAGRPAMGLLLAIFALLNLAAPAAAQDWFRTGTGLGVSKPKVAVADFAARNDTNRERWRCSSATWCETIWTSAGLSIWRARAFIPRRCPACPPS